MELSAALRQCLLGGKSGAGMKFHSTNHTAALSNTGIPKVNTASAATPDEQPEVDVSDEEFLRFDTTAVPVGRHYIVDATSEEKSQMSSVVSVSINRQ
ncbi:putative PNPase/RNase PH domain superfamily [Helianthus annuus]|nr:putative PNPase/RNase PH domain superfamily [Helianthus annuus]KAJ0651183.1 putative PNPase/RNase PH domain superfamily [Helianthus annuus]